METNVYRAPTTGSESPLAGHLSEADVVPKTDMLNPGPQNQYLEPGFHELCLSKAHSLCTSPPCLLVWKLSGSAHSAAVCSFPPYTDIPRAPCLLFVGTFFIFRHSKPDVSES